MVATPVRTARLLLRCYEPADTPLVVAAIERSLEHLRAWMTWAVDEPLPPARREALQEHFRADFAAARDWTYGIFDPAGRELLGGTGLHRSLGEGALEIGYWIRADCINRGYATEAAGALTRVAFEVHGVRWVEIRCDPANVRSAAVPRKLGYRYAGTIPDDAVTPAGEPRDSMVWVMERALYPASPARRVFVAGLNSAMAAEMEDGAGGPPPL